MNRVRQRNLGALLAKAQWGALIVAGKIDNGTLAVVDHAGRPPFPVSRRRGEMAPEGPLG